MLKITSKQLEMILWVVALLFLFLIRAGNLHLLGLFDYDAVTNYTIITELANKDFSHLFHHASPLFYISFLPFFLLFQNYVSLEYIFVFFNLVSILFFVNIYSKQLHLSFLGRYLTFLLVGSSMVNFAASRYFSIDSFSLTFLLASFYFFYKCIYEAFQSKIWCLTWLSLSVAITINYKLVYFLAPFFFLAIFKRKSQIDSRNWFLALLMLVAIPAIMILVGWLNGKEILAYPKSFFVQVFIKDMNPYADVPPIRLDADFYLKYVLSYEPVWLVLGLILLFFLIAKSKRMLEIAKENTVLSYLILLSLPYLFLLCFLQKAPRGLLPVYIPFSLALIFYCTKFINRKWFTVICVVIFLIQNSFIYKEFYGTQHNGYKAVADFLQEEQIDKLIITSGKGIFPFLDTGIDYKVIFHEGEIAPLRQAGYHYLLIDYYFLVAHPNNFNGLAVKDALFRAKESTLTNRMLFLEHSEYTGLSYEQSLQNFKKISNLNHQLYLLDLSKL